MKTLADFDGIALTAPEQPRGFKLRIHNALPKAVLVAAKDRTAQLAALDEMTGAYVLLMPADVLPREDMTRISPDPVLLEAGYRLDWLAQNKVTGQLDATPGPQLWLRAELRKSWMDEKKGNSKAIVMPNIVADWAFNYASRPAFTAGFGYASHLLLHPDTHIKMMVAASFGGDQTYADWWHLGFMISLTGSNDALFEYAQEKAGMTAGLKMQERLHDLTRQINAALGLGISRIEKTNAAFFRTQRFSKPDASIYCDLIAAYAPLGKAGRAAADHWREAARWIWGFEANSPSG